MTLLVTGGAGFLGSRLIEALLRADPSPARVICLDTAPSPLTDSRVESRIGSVTDEAFVRDAIRTDAPRTIWHLAAVLSGQSEAEFERGLSVNVGGTKSLLDACHGLPHPPRFVFSSTIAVFGGSLPAIVPAGTAVLPQSSYGMAKAIAELLVLEYTRRGIADGVVCRVPTVCVRPGSPNSALSSFVSGIVREPLAGLPSVCPVPIDTRLWVSSPDVTTGNLVHAGWMDTTPLGPARIIDLPGITVTPADLLGALERVGGPGARALVRHEPDPVASRVVASWPGGLDTTRALALGFTHDRDAAAIVAQFVRDRDRAVAGSAPADLVG